MDEPIANSSMLVLPNRIASACLEPRDHGGVVGRPEVPEHLAAAGGRLALDAEHVLDRDRQPASGPSGSPASPLSIGPRLGENGSRVEMDERIEPLRAARLGRGSSRTTSSDVTSPCVQLGEKSGGGVMLIDVVLSRARE